MTAEEQSLREQFLLAGEKMIAESGGLLGGLDQVTVSSLVRELTSTQSRSSFHAIWRTRDDYIGDLLERLLTYGIAAFETVSTVVGEVLANDVPPWPDMIRDGANANFSDVRDAEDLRRFREAIAFKDHPVYGPTVQEALKTQYSRLVNVFADFYRLFFPVYRRRVKSPLSIEDLVVIVAALVEGLSFTWQVDPDRVRADLEWNGSGGWSLFAVSLHALFEELTEPMPG